MKKPMRRKKRSPIREEEGVLPLPGRSCRRRIDDEIDSAMAGIAAVGILFGFGVGAYWARLSGAGWPDLTILALILLMLLPVGFYWLWRKKRIINDFALGQDGEIYVAQLLETLRGHFGPDAIAVFHDLPGHPKTKVRKKRRWNIDHVVVGPMGVWAIETKTPRKWAEPRGDQKLYYDGTRITFNKAKEYPQSDSMLRQADRGAERVRELLKATTHRDYRVRSALLFPGWWVGTEGSANGYQDPRWVMNPKGFVKRLAKIESVLSRGDVALAIDRLSLLARQSQDDS